MDAKPWNIVNQATFLHGYTIVMQLRSWSSFFSIVELVYWYRGDREHDDENVFWLLGMISNLYKSMHKMDYPFHRRQELFDDQKSFGHLGMTSNLL